MNYHKEINRWER